MKTGPRIAPGVALLTALVLAAPSWSEGADSEGFVPLFNGKDLKGWVNVNCAPGTFFVKDGEIITTGRPTGFLRTERRYENFIADFEWMHVNKQKPGNSGFFVWADPLPAIGIPYTRGIEVQVLVNMDKEGYYTSHGDLFSIHGATSTPDRPHPHGWARCLPSERRCKGGGEWNHYRVIARDGVLKLHVNGKEVSGLSACRPGKGYLALESEGAECHFRNLKIKELPSSHPPAAEVAEKDRGFTSLFTGLDLSGWKTKTGKDHWQADDGVLRHTGSEESATDTLVSEKEYGDLELIVDFRSSKKSDRSAWALTLRMGEDDVNLSFPTSEEMVVHTPGREAHSTARGGKSDEWRRLRLSLVGGAFTARINEQQHVQMEVPARAARSALRLQATGAMEFRNLFVRHAAGGSGRE